MKNLVSTIIVLLSLVSSVKAFAFVTVIDVHESSREVTTIYPDMLYPLEELQHKYLSYRGNSSEAIELFESIVYAQISEQLVVLNFEVNESVGTIAVTLKVDGYLGSQYYYYIIQQESK
ncbi:MAG: hypothetical protein R3B45_00205 [Bdellovibrionota bacterium]